MDKYDHKLQYNEDQTALLSRCNRIKKWEQMQIYTPHRWWRARTHDSCAYTCTPTHGQTQNTLSVWLLFLQSLGVRFAHKHVSKIYCLYRKDYCSPLNMCFYLSQTFKRAGPCCDIIVSCSSKPECLTFFQLIQKQKFFLQCSSLCIYKERTIKLSCFIKMVHMTCMNFSKYFKAIFFFFTFTHLADAFIQSDLQCIQVIHVLSVCVFPGNRTHNLCAANAMLYHWATGTLPQEHFHRNTSTGTLPYDSFVWDA